MVNDKEWLDNKRNALAAAVENLVTIFNNETGLFITDISIPNYIRISTNAGTSSYHYTDRLTITARVK